MSEYTTTPERTLFDEDNYYADKLKVNPDFKFANIDINELKEEVEDHLIRSKNSNTSANLKTVLATNDKLKELKATEIKFSEPILKHGENAIIFPRTINVVQGQNGTHKSRIAETALSAIIKKAGCDKELLGFKRTSSNATYTGVYTDTERNLSEQLPYALQSILINAGYNKADNPENFEYISLLQIKRKDRFSVLTEYLNYLKDRTENPLFIVLDVSTDCIEDFNRVDKSMELIDLMNMTINEHNVTFLCLIHENPGSEKGRGHFGTELMNKASTVMQVSFEKDSSGENTEIIKVKYLKCRSTAKHPPFHIKYSNEAKGLILADANDVSGIINNRKHKARNEDMVDFIEMYLGDGTILPRVELLDKLCQDFKASPRTIESRISELISSDIEIINKNGESCKLSKETKEKCVYYKLIHYENI